jgi:hypothetical protein
MLLIAKFLTGTERNKRILIQRSQFLIIAAFEVLKTNIRKNCNFIEAASFQLYVAASSVRSSFNGLRFYISEYNGQGHLANDEILF